MGHEEKNAKGLSFDTDSLFIKNNDLISFLNTFLVCEIRQEPEQEHTETSINKREKAAP